MGIKDFFTGKKNQNADCCGVQIVPDDGHDATTDTNTEGDTDAHAGDTNGQACDTTPCADSGSNSAEARGDAPRPE